MLLFHSYMLHLTENCIFMQLLRRYVRFNRINIHKSVHLATQVALQHQKRFGNHVMSVDISIDMHERTRSVRRQCRLTPHLTVLCMPGLRRHVAVHWLLLYAEIRHHRGVVGSWHRSECPVTSIIDTRLVPDTRLFRVGNTFSKPLFCCFFTGNLNAPCLEVCFSKHLLTWNQSPSSGNRTESAIKRTHQRTPVKFCRNILIHHGSLKETVFIVLINGKKPALVLPSQKVSVTAHPGFGRTRCQSVCVHWSDSSESWLPPSATV